MVDTFTPTQRSQIMASVKGNGNKSTELKLIEYFKEYNIKGWRRKYLIAGNPDFVIPKARLAIFVDGCFWHGCKEHCRLPETNREYWSSKIDRNIKRDKIINIDLTAKNWHVIRIWEHDLKKNNYREILKKIKDLVKKGSA
jgi:DNA mismatch endonuclease, patch repair protein